MRTYVLAAVHALVCGVVIPVVLVSVVAFVIGYIGLREAFGERGDEAILLILNLVAVYLSPRVTMPFIHAHISRADKGNFLLIATLSFLILQMFMFIIPLPEVNGYVAVYLINAFLVTGIFYWRTSKA